MEYSQDAALCQLLLRKRLVEIEDLTACSEMQREDIKKGEDPRSLRDLLLSIDALSSCEMEAALLDRVAGDSSRLRRLSDSSGSGRKRRSSSRVRKAEEFHDVGPYEIRERIAKGGMGAIYKAHDRITNKTVALKVLLAARHDREADVERFLREARIACSLDHSGLVRGLSFGKHEGVPFFAMEYVPGESLRARLGDQGALPPRVATDMVLRISRALGFVHEAGLVHRDIKPDNILLGGDGAVKLCDLGLAREVNLVTNLTQSGQTLGTPRYISPEQARAERDVDLRSDIYSLGITFFHMLTGRPPFTESSGIVVMSRHLYDEVPLIRSIDPSLPAELEAIVVKMCKKHRDDRYSDVKALVKDLEAFAKGRRQTGRHRAQRPTTVRKGRALTGFGGDSASRVKASSHQAPRAGAA